MLSGALLDQARLFLWLGLLLRGRSPLRGLNAFERAADLFRKLDRPLEFGYASARLARALAVMQRFEESKAVLAEARPKLANCAFPKILAFYHGSAATLNALTDDPEAARTHFHTALTLFREAGSETAALESISNLADISWNLGDLAAAEESLRDYIAMRGAPFVRPTGLAVARGNLAGILTEQGRLSEALEAATEATPGLLEVGLAWTVMDHFALRAALAGQLDNAARLAGFADGAHAAEQAVRAPNETRARRRLQALLEERLDEEQRRRLIGEGQLMTIEEAAELALRK